MSRYSPRRTRRTASRAGRRPRAVEVVAREVGAVRKYAAVDARLVEGVEHEVDQLTKAVGHEGHMAA